MAAKTKAAKPSAADMALARAREALALALTNPSPRPLLGTAAQPGFFTGSTQPVKAAAKLCEERGWVEPTGETVGSGKSAKALYRLTTAGAREALARLDCAVLGSFRSALDRIQEGLRTLRALETALAPVQAALDQLAASAPSAGPASTPGPHPPAESAPVPGERLRDVLHRQYDYLCRLVEFQDRLVAVPRLFDKAKEALPRLTPDQFQAELLSLEDERAVELHILNEVHTADRPELGIRRGNALYYYVLWKR